MALLYFTKALDQVFGQKLLINLHEKGITLKIVSWLNCIPKTLAVWGAAFKPIEVYKEFGLTRHRH